jgi:hypothetical protein
MIFFQTVSEILDNFTGFFAYIGKNVEIDALSSPRGKSRSHMLNHCTSPCNLENTGNPFLFKRLFCHLGKSPVREVLHAHEVTFDDRLRISENQSLTGSANFASSAAEAFSTSAWRLFPCESIVTIAGKSFTLICHIASGMPNSRKSTPVTSTMHFV